MISALLVTTMLSASAAQPAACVTLEDCRRLTREAIAAREYERAHDLAWLAYQRGSGRDAEALTLLARAQSLSGRGDDAYVMLRRIAERGVAVPDIESSDDFARVRAHDRWPQLREAFDKLAAAGAAALAPPRAAAAPAVPEPARPAAPAAGKPLTKPSPEVTPVVPAASVVTRVGEDLALPAGAVTPAGIAYDAVSARFILSSAATDALTVLSQTSSNATPLTSRGWSGFDQATALAIDRRAGDLWVAVNGASGAALHRLQLISGRRLNVVTGPDDKPAHVVALAVAAEGVYALDAQNRRLLRCAATDKSLIAHLSLPDEITPTGLAAGGSGLYIAHSTGLLRFDVASRRLRAVGAAKGIDVSGLRSLAWNDGKLLAIQTRTQGAALVRLAMNRAGTAVTAVETLGPAAADVATLAAGVYYYIAVDDQNRRVLRAVAAR